MTTLSAWLGARLLAGLAGTTPVASPPDVVVDASVVEGEALARRLVTGLEPLAYLLPSTPGAAASIRVTGELLDFRVGLSLGPADAPAWSWCPCTHAELVTHVQRRLAHALRPPSRCPPPPPRELAPVRASAPSRSLARPVARPVAPPVPAPGRRIRWGAPLVGMGGIALGTGLGVMLAAELATDGEQWAPRSDLRPLGITAVAVGTSVLAAGSLLLLLDRRLSRARRRAAHP